MNWSDFKDPQGIVEVRQDMSVLKAYCTPEELQEMANTKGMQAVVNFANSKLRHAPQRLRFSIIEMNGTKILMASQSVGPTSI